jgi:hypothetical protein
MGVFDNDILEIFFDPEGRGINYYQFALTAGNVQFDMYFIERGNTTIGHYSGLWESAVFKGKDFWSVEMRVPLDTLYHTPSNLFSTTWKLNITRTWTRLDKKSRIDNWFLSTWSPLKLSFHEPDAFNTVGHMPKKPSSQDMKIVGMEAEIYEETADNLTGKLTIKATAQSAAAGTYTLTLTDDNRELIPAQTITITTPECVISFENVTFKSKGRNLIRATVKTDKGEPVNAMSYPVLVEYEPIKITMTEPFYGNCIFPGQEVNAISGSFCANIPSAWLEKTEAEVKLTGTDQNPVSGPLKDGCFAFSFPATTLTVGDYTLNCTLRMSGKTVANKKLTIRKLPPAPGSYAYLDKNRIVIADGKPVFARSWYGGPGYLTSQAINARNKNGYEGAFLNAAGKQCPEEMESERIDRDDVPRTRMDVKPSQKVFDEMKRKIEKHRTSKNVWWYYLCDEPECRGVSPVYLKYQYDFIKKLDPYRMVMIVTREPEKFTKCADILTPHPYSNPMIDANGKRKMESPKAVRRQMRTILDAADVRCAAWLCPQAFRYGGIKTADYPNFDEYNCMLWTAIANGATGMTPFLYNDHFNSVDLRLGNEFIYETIASVEDFLLSPRSVLPAKVTAEDDGVDVRIIKLNGNTFVIAVNLLDKPTTATITCDGLSDGILYGYREKGKTAVVKSAFTLSFAPYQVHLLMNPKAGGKMKSVETLKAQIAAEYEAMKKRGNVLYGMSRDDVLWEASDTYTMGDFMYADQLINGIRDQIGWASWAKAVDEKNPGWVVMTLAKTPVTFSRAELYTATVEDLEFQVWKEGAWKKIGEAKGNQGPVIKFKFAEPVTTSKIRIWMTKVHPNMRAELYEIELYR